MLLDESSMREMVYGGAVLGAGGGGSIQGGLAAGRKALRRGRPRLITIAELPDNACLLTFSFVGPAGKTFGDDLHGQHHMRALQLFSRISKQRAAGFVPSEVGALAVTYGWEQAALLGVPIVDAPCNGRAHPLGLMGSLGLHRLSTHVTTTVGVGGVAGSDRYLELALRTNVVRAARMIRAASASTGVPLAVARNPAPVWYVRRHAALGGLAAARSLGRVLLNNLGDGTAAVLESVARASRGAVAAQGRVRSAEVSERSGFTIGRIVIDGDDSSQLLVPVCNEYMMLIKNETQLAAFPDLITIFDFQSSLPLSSAEVSAGRRVAILIVPQKKLTLGSTMRDRGLLRPLEELLAIRFPSSNQANQRNAQFTPEQQRRPNDN
jgi:DUF917 family protein